MRRDYISCSVVAVEKLVEMSLLDDLAAMKSLAVRPEVKPVERGKALEVVCTLNQPRGPPVSSESRFHLVSTTRRWSPRSMSKSALSARVFLPCLLGR
jgi:hypothetical protein